MLDEITMRLSRIEKALNVNTDSFDIPNTRAKARNLQSNLFEKIEGILYVKTNDLRTKLVRSRVIHLDTYVQFKGN